MDRGAGMSEKTLEIYMSELREQIARDIESNELLLQDAKQLGSDALLVAYRSRMACAAIARGLVK
jgi:hypothetical protein